MTFPNYYKDVSKKFMFIAAFIFTILDFKKSHYFNLATLTKELVWLLRLKLQSNINFNKQDV